MSARYVIVCNTCSTIAKESSVKGVASARRMNRPHGWANPRAGVDLCPDCKPKPKEDPYAGYL